MNTARNLPLVSLLLAAPALSQVVTFPNGWQDPAQIDGDGSRTLFRVGELQPSGQLRLIYYLWQVDGPPIETVNWGTAFHQEFCPSALSDDGETVLFGFSDGAPTLDVRVHRVSAGTTTTLSGTEAGTGAGIGLYEPGPMSADGLAYFGSSFTFAPNGTEPTVGRRWSLGSPASSVCQVNPSVPCNFVPSFTSSDGQLVVGRLFDEFHGAYPQVYRSTPQGPLELVTANGTVDGMSADGATIVGQLPSGEIYRWTELGGLVNIGAPSGTPASTEFIHVDGSGEVIMGFFPAHVWRASSGWGPLSAELTARGMSGFGLPSSGDLWVRDLSSDGNAVLLPAAAGADSYSAMVYLDGQVPGAIGTNVCGPGVRNSTGRPAFVLAKGSLQTADNNVTILANALPSNVFGFLLNSQGADFVPASGGSAGSLCLGGGSSIGRHVGPGEIQSSGNDGKISVDLELTQLPRASGVTAVGPGDIYRFQVWYRDRDASGMPASNFTDAVSLAFQ